MEIFVIKASKEERHLRFRTIESYKYYFLQLSNMINFPL